MVKSVVINEDNNTTHVVNATTSGDTSVATATNNTSGTVTGRGASGKNGKNKNNFKKKSNEKRAFGKSDSKFKGKCSNLEGHILTVPDPGRLTST